MMETALKLGADLNNISQACDALLIPRATLYRGLKPEEASERRPRPESPRALPPETKKKILDHLHSPRFIDRSPNEVFYTLLDQDIYLGSIRSYYRILEANKEVKERRNQLRHPKHKKPELLATAPRQVWTWDITKLKGPGKWEYYHLYVVLDIYSRYIVGWMLAPRESGELAKQLLAESCERQCIEPHQLTIHSDRGAAMQSKPVVALLSQLDVLKTNSRPHVSNDNPFSESQFKTTKYHPEFPNRFGGFEHALTFLRSFVPWYNDSHRHSGIRYLTPANVHHGQADAVLNARYVTKISAYDAHPERFIQGPPRLQKLPEAVYINPPTSKKEPVAEYSLN
jgi:putative transposase